jgi:outer membrane protein
MAAATAGAQQSGSPLALTIGQAVQQALQNYPAIRVTQEQMNAAAAGIRLARTAYLPRVEGIVQANRATRNTYYGLLLPQTVIPSVDGVPAHNFGSVWDSGAGLLVTWQPFDFGLRHAAVMTAKVAEEQARAAANRSRYDVSVATADAFLTVVAAQQTARAARAAVESWQVLLKSIHALVNAQLRPGADESRVQAELAVAQTQEAQADQAIEVARATLAQFTGSQPSAAQLEPGKLLAQLPAEESSPPPDLTANPLTVQQNASIKIEQARLHELERTYYPRFTLGGTASARGTGIELNGNRLGGWNGLAPTVPNVGVGLTVTFPFTDRFALHEQETAEAANLRAAQAQYEVIAKDVQARFDAALAALNGARRVAKITPVEVTAAQAAFDQARARYQSGLAPVDDLAQAQRVLASARIDDSLARLNVWRAFLEVVTARGNIQAFLNEASR